MKNLYLIRHAKSDWSNPLLSDFDRSLNKRGLKEAPLMGGILSKKGVHPDLILSSPALRAKTTAIEIARKLSYPLESIVYLPALYASDCETIFSILKDVSNTVNTLIVLGHNPEFTECVNAISGFEIENIPTCGIAAMGLYEEKWSSIGLNSAQLLFLDTPKQYR